MSARLQTVHSWHPPIHEHNVIRIGGVVLFEGGDRFFSRSHRVDSPGNAAQWLLQNLARGRIVVHHEHPKLRESFGENFAQTLCTSNPKPNGEEKRATYARLTLQPDASAHQ